MANKTKEQLIVANNTSFPNNNAGAITATVLRDFNTNMIDSTVNQGVYTTDSASFDSRIDALSGSVAVDTGSLLVTASFASQNLTFTKGDGSQFSVFIPDDSGSILPSGVVSGSSQIDYPLISNIPAGIVSGSSQLTASYDLRYELSGSSTPLPSGVVSGSSQIDYPQISNIPSGIISSSEQLPSGLVSGSSQVSYTELSNIPSGIVSSSSQIILQDTTGLLSGSRIDGEVALALNSTYAQNTIATGKNLHNTTIDKGTPLYFTGSGTSGNLVGVYPADAGNPSRMPAGGVAGESLAVGAEGIVLLDGYIGGVDTSLFASGDEVFVAVGGGYTNSAPTGSALIQHLGNVEKVAVNGSGVIQMMGEVRGLPNLTSGYAWVGDSNGVPQAVSTGSWGGGGGSDLTSLNAFTSSQIDLNATFATTGSNTFIGNQVFDSVDLYLSGSAGSRLNLFQDGLSQIRFWSGSNQTEVGTWVNMQTNPANGAIAISSFPDNNHFVDFNPAVTESQFTAPIRLDGGINGNVTLNGRQTITGPTSGPTSPQLIISSSDANILATRQQFTFRKAGADYNGYFGRGTMYLVSEPGVGTEFTVANFDEPDFVNDVEYSVKVDENGIVFRDWDNASAFEFQTWLSIAPNLGNTPDVRFLRNLQVTGSIDVTGELTASLQQGYVWVGDVNGRTTTVSTGSFGGGGGASFPYSGSVEITGSVKVKPYTLSVVSDTASIDMNESNYFILNLPTGATTHVDFTNIIPGESINLLVSQSSGVTTGSIDFAPNIYFPAGNNMVATQTGSARDIVSFITFNENEIYATSVKNLY